MHPAVLLKRQRPRYLGIISIKVAPAPSFSIGINPSKGFVLSYTTREIGSPPSLTG